jgi:hypothetical protein
MPLIDLPPQVKAECDCNGPACVHELDVDGMIPYFEKAKAKEGLGDYGWELMEDGTVVCEDCASHRRAEARDGR